MLLNFAIFSCFVYKKRRDLAKVSCCAGRLWQIKTKIKKAGKFKKFSLQNILYEPIRSLGRSPNKVFIPNLSPALSWAVSCLLDASLSNFSLFWIPFGHHKFTTCMDSSFWSLSFWSSPVLRRPSFYAISTYALKTTIGGGEDSWPVDSLPFIYLSTVSITSWPSWT